MVYAVLIVGALGIALWFIAEVLTLLYGITEITLNAVLSLFGYQPVVLSELHRNYRFKKKGATAPSLVVGTANLKANHAAELETFLNQLNADSIATYPDKMATRFLNQVIVDESQRPSSMYFRRWRERSDVPELLKSYGDQVLAAINKRLSDVKKDAQRKEDERHQSLAELVMSRHPEKIGKFTEIAYRRVCTVDDYGDENVKALDEEIVRLIRKIASVDPALRGEFSRRSKGESELPFSRIDKPVSFFIAQGLKERFEEYYRGQKSKIGNLDKEAISQMSGEEFEQFLMNLLKKCGATEVMGTPGSGDQGADVIFTFNGVRVAVQAKRYKSKVGNKAIQEVHAARGFYKCDEAWVITNASFTPSALALANQLGVILVDGMDLARLEFRFLEYFKRQFRASA